ncbi:helix-turn-helix transcriptional regulator [uncultured Litoreibacter sp.]|uniref:helix-turn-helix transcriptional regulator n=1 Tax=uncultured Litoreibacter sp. TaxID=1392394 RepID=UPI0026182422|nr:helix-turn-helix transcriptional regulator [uncultured Litoreibacter sp.]
MDETQTAQTTQGHADIAQAAVAADWLLLAETWLSACSSRSNFSRPLADIQANVGAISATLFHVPAMRTPPSMVAAVSQRGIQSAATPATNRTDLAQLSRSVDVQFLSQLKGTGSIKPRNKTKAKRELETAVVMLHRGTAGYDILEVTFDGHPTETAIADLKATAAFLIRNWIPSEKVQPTSDCPDASHGEAYQPNGILGEMNPYKLSPSEMRVCSMIGQGMSPAEIAATLGLSVETIRTHLKGIFVKTETSSQRELMLMIFKPTPMRAAS